MPSCSPFCPIMRTSRARIWLLIRRSFEMGEPPQNIEKQRQPHIAAPIILPLLTGVRQWQKHVNERLGTAFPDAQLRSIGRELKTSNRTIPSAQLRHHRGTPWHADGTPIRHFRSDRPAREICSSRSSLPRSRFQPCVLASPARVLLVPTVGLEPTMPKGPGILSPVRMPIPPRRRRRLNPAILSRLTFQNLSQRANLVCSRQGRGAMIAMGMCWNW